MNRNDYLPENATIQYDQITQVNISVGFAWRFYYANGETYLTESADDKQKLAVLVNGWKLQKDIKIDIYTKPAPVVTEPQTAAYQAAVDNTFFEQIWTAGQIKSDWASRKMYEEDDRISYVVDLEHRLELALDRKNKLGYQLDI